MTASLSRAATNTRIGTCPHGLPLGACPICNGMGGGGGVKRDNKPKEMSYNECYAVWQMMKAQKAARKELQQQFAIQDLAANLNKIQDKIIAFKTAVQNSSLPKPIIKAVVVFADSVLMPLAKAIKAISNVVQDIAQTINKAVENLKQKAIDIMDKLTAVFGEVKAAIQKKIEEKFKEVKKKIFNLFGIFETENEEDEDVKKIEEQKRLQEENTTKEIVLRTPNLKEKENK